MIKRAVIALLIVLLAATVVPARELEGVDMPESIKIDGKTVVLNGVGLRKVMFIKPYVGGLYLTSAQTDGNAVMSAEEPMAIRLHMIDDVGQKMMLRSLYNGMRSSVKSTGGDFAALESRIEQLKGYFTAEIKKGDIYDFTYIPGKGVSVIMNQQKKGVIEGTDFKQAFFGIWLNSDSPADSNLRTAMLAGDVRAATATADDATAKAEAAAAQQKAEMAAKAQAAAEEKAKAEAAMIGAKAKAEAEAKAAQEKAQAEADKKAADMKADAVNGMNAAEESAAKAADQPTPAAPPAEEKTAPAAPPADAKAPAAAESVAPVSSAQEIESQDVYFAASKTTLGPKGRKNVDGKIAWLKANPAAKVVIEMQVLPADLQTAEQRADSIIDYMKAAGIESSRMEKKVSGDGTATASSLRAHFRVTP